MEPLRWRFQRAEEELGIAGEPRVDHFESEMCSMKLIFMHRPTHDPRRDKSGDYPFSWHLAGRRRLWEIRLQVRFKRVPARPLFVGVELDRYVPVSGMTRQAQKVLISACRGVVGDCYHSPGDDPARTEGEAEPPTFVMPLWAFDQFEVSSPGEEPDLAGSLDGKGVRRADGVSAYIAAMKAAISSFSTEKVYTFCFWGISQFLDCMQWEVTGGVLPGVRLDFNKLCGQPPIYLAIYELEDIQQDPSRWRQDRRHLASRKRYCLRAAVWSELRPPRQGAAPESPRASLSGGLSPLAGLEDSPLGGSPRDALDMDWLCDGTHEEAPAAPGPALPAPAAFEDLLGLAAASREDPRGSAAHGPPKVETCDLLGLDFS